MIKSIPRNHEREVPPGHVTSLEASPELEWLRNRSFHCVITGPLFLIGGVVVLLSGTRTIHVDTLWVGPVLFIGVGIAFLLEWRYGRRPVP